MLSGEGSLEPLPELCASQCTCFGLVCELTGAEADLPSFEFSFGAYDLDHTYGLRERGRIAD